MPLSTYMTFALPWFVCVPAVGGFPLARATLGIIRATIASGSSFLITDSLLCSFLSMVESWLGVVRAEPSRCKHLVKRVALPWASVLSPDRGYLVRPNSRLSGVASLL